MKRRRNKSEGIFAKLFNTIVTICLTIGMLWGLQACSHSTSLKFVQLSDIHFLENGQNTTFKMTGASSQLLDDAIEQINEEQEIDFVMLTGDIIDKPFEKELRAFLPHIENLKYPWYFAFGNHDRCVGGYLTTSVYMDMVKKSNKNYNFNKPYYAFTPKKGYRVIVLDNIITDKVTTQGYLGEEQVLWLKKELDKSKRDTVLIGTPGVAAPEQYGFAQSDVRTDIYSLDLLIKQLFPNDSKMLKISEKATKMDPNYRYSSVINLKSDIETFLFKKV